MSDLEQQQQPTEEELVDYEEPETTETTEATEAQKTGNYVAIHASGFRDFYLKPEILRAIGDAGFEHPSEVQHETIPQAATGNDILCQAKSGLGKTAVFVISTLQQLEIKDNAVLCLVIGHTRELAYQIKSEYERFAKYIAGIRISVVFGGTPEETDVKLVTSEETVPHVLIGTPGRILGLTKKGLDLSKLKHFVVDECDKVLEKQEMRADVFNIYAAAAASSFQVMMLSATMSAEMKEVCKKLMKNPTEVFVDDEGKLTLHGLLQHYVPLSENQKTAKLAAILKDFQFNQVIIFVKSPQRAKALANLLTAEQYPAICVHGSMKQEERLKQYKAFKDFQARILVATDLFGRGIDVERVNVVVNYDMPDSAESYLHRVGRAGRFGTKGLAVTFTASDEDKVVLDSVQSRFEVKIEELPETIDAALYTNA